MFWQCCRIRLVLYQRIKSYLLCINQCSSWVLVFPFWIIIIFNDMFLFFGLILMSFKSHVVSN
jgi:hypothetical protein